VLLLTKTFKNIPVMSTLRVFGMVMDMTVLICLVWYDLLQPIHTEHTAECN